MEQKMIVMWRDKRLEDMTKDQLVEALREAARLLQFYQAPGWARAMALGTIEMMKRGEK